MRVAGQSSVPWSCDTQNLLQLHLKNKEHQHSDPARGTRVCVVACSSTHSSNTMQLLLICWSALNVLMRNREQNSDTPEEHPQVNRPSFGAGATADSSNRAEHSGR